MNIPEGLVYTKEHEWARIQGKTATVGITDYAQHALGDITFIETPQAGKTVEQFKFLATVESVKAASDVYSPLSGKVLKVNENLAAHPELINQSAYEEGWIAVIEIATPKEKDALMSSAAYTKYIEGLSK